LSEVVEAVSVESERLRARVADKVCQDCKYYEAYNCSLQPGKFVVLSPIHPACEKFEPKPLEEKRVEEGLAEEGGKGVEPQPVAEQPVTLLEQAPLVVQEKRPILPAKPLKHWQVGELDIYLFEKPFALAGYRQGEEVFIIKLANLSAKEAAQRLRDEVLKASMLSEDEAEQLRVVCRELEKLLAERPKEVEIPLETVVERGELRVRTSLVLVEKEGQVEASLRRYTAKGYGNKPVAVLPKITLLHDLATGNAFFLAREGDKIVAVSTDLEGLLRQLVVRGYIAKPSLADITFQFVLREVVQRERGELAPGLGQNGFIDPLGVGLDLSDYGVEGLLAAKEWIEKYYPESNRKAALANVALAVAKLVSPAMRKQNPTFIDSIVWNYGRGGEGKTTLLTLIVLPLLSIPLDDEKTLVFIRGAVETSAQMAFLLTVNRLPLILDEQTLSALVKNADILLSAVVGQGVVKIHAPRYGLLGEVRFKNLRGLIVATNVEFSKWLRKVREHASDLAFTRRVIEIEWENESLKPEAFDDIPRAKPILHAVERAWKLKYSELVKCKDVAELAERLFKALAELYNVDLSSYIEAVREVRSRWESVKDGFKFTDVDIVRERAYEIARQQLGVSGLTGAKVLLSILENPSAYGVCFTKPKDVNEAGSEAGELLELADKLSVVEQNKNLCEKLQQLAGSSSTRIVLKAGGPLVPGAPHFFLGAVINNYKFGSSYANGYCLPLARFAKIFLEEGAEGADSNGSAKDENTEKENG